MVKLKIALIREEKIPRDTRVAFSPVQCQWLMNKYPGLEIVVQSSASRCFNDDEYRHEDVTVLEDVSDADLLIGIKEIPAEKLLTNKNYLFFSHTGPDRRSIRIFSYPPGVALGASFMARLTLQNLAERTPWSCAFSTFGLPLSP